MLRNVATVTIAAGDLYALWAAYRGRRPPALLLVLLAAGTAWGAYERLTSDR